MLAPKKGETTSLSRYSNVFFVLSVVISICLVNVYQANGHTTNEAELNFAPEHIEQTCIEKCPDQNQNASNSAECVEQCGQTQCAAGCRLWETALDTSCKAACNTTDQDVEDWYCVMGCNNAISRYFNWLMEEIGKPPAPALLADSLTSTSLSLEWEVPEHLSSIMKRRKNVLKNYLVQWRYEESGNDWKYYRNQSMEGSTTIHVENLQPYTKYRFRVALILSSFREIELYSEQSLVIITAEEGPPQSEPDIVRAVAVDHTRISISWEPGLLKNGPILFYVLQIKESHRDTYFAIKVQNNFQMHFEMLRILSSFLSNAHVLFNVVSSLV